MIPPLTKLGDRTLNDNGVLAFIKDIMQTIRTKQEQKFIILAYGNLITLPEIEAMWRDCALDLLNRSEYEKVVCYYGSSQGYQPLIESLVQDFNQRYGLNLSESNILITPGSQSIYFYAANIFGGYTSDRLLKRIVLPLSPEYSGYNRVCLTPEAVSSYKPIIEIDEKTYRFKYFPDFSQLTISEDVGCVLFSRPCNPTGTVLTDEEVKKIAALAEPYNVPLLIDSAYGPPFPSLNFTEMKPVFGNSIVHCMSFSKVWLPSERIGVAIGEPKIIRLMESFHRNLCIHSSRFGQSLATTAENIEIERGMQRFTKVVERVFGEIISIANHPQKRNIHVKKSFFDSKSR